MSLAALSDLDDAIDATKRFLTPFDRVRWFRLAVVMFFVGGAGFSFPGFPGFGGGSDPGQPMPGEPGPDITPQVTTELLVLIAGIILVGLLAFLLYSVAAATMEFVFVASLRDEEVRLRRYFKRYWRKGLRLFVFRFLVWTVSGGGAVAALLGVGTAMSGWPPTAWSDGAILAVILLAIPVFLLIALVVGTLLGFTTMFVVPVMLREDRGVIGGWRRFWSTLVGNLVEFVAYLFVSFLLSIAVGMAVGFLLVLGAIALAVPFLVVGVPLLLVLGFSGAGGLVAIVLVLAYLLLLFVVALLVQVPFQTFLRYYALLVLGDVDDELDVIPDARAAVRADGGEGTGETGDDAGEGDGADAGHGGGPEDPGVGGTSAGRTSGGETDTGGTSVGDPFEPTDGADDDGWNVDPDDDRNDRSDRS
ncbi:hypothetical protein [Halosimplex sp. TS25]|uniref:DUF7544 domain-containing protein n=1 Tax=Halosimplex rarum TaxID=3396619 RepID=UPI0039E8775B